MFDFELENASGNIVNINDGVKYIVVPPVSGLNPPSATLFMSKSPNGKGSKHNGSTLDERPVLITIKILGDIEKNRNALYEWIDTEQYIKIRYRNGVKNVYIEGIVQDCPIDLFTDNEVVSLSVTCGDPYWKELQDIVTEISALLKQFIFPFAIDNYGEPFSTLRESNTTNVFNSGAETGLKISVKAVKAIKNLMIYDANDTTRILKINGTIPEDYTLEIDTESSPKTIKAKTPEGKFVNYMRYVSGRPTWFTLRKGHNLFGYSAETGESEAEVTISFTNKYLGV